MNKIQYKIAFIFLILISFILVSLYYVDINISSNAEMLVQGAKQRQTKLLTTTVETITKNMNEWCYDYTYWDEMVEFVKNPDASWAKRNIEASTINYEISFAWVFDSKFKQKYGYQTLAENGTSNSFIKKEELNNAIKENWFSNFFYYSNGKIFEIHTAPIQPSMDIERKTEPKGWLLVGRVYKGKLIDDISNTINSNIRDSFF